MCDTSMPPLPPASRRTSGTTAASSTVAAQWSHVGHHRTSISPEMTFDEHDSQIKHELLALITQYLQQEGFTMSSVTIQDEANVKLHGRMQERDALRRLSVAIMDGDWDLVAKLLGKHLKKFHAAHQGFLYAVCKQEYLELIDRQEYQKAYTFLTTHLKPLEKVAAATSSSRHEFKELCYLLTCKAVGESDAFRDWEGVVTSREKLVEQLRATFALDEVFFPQQDGVAVLWTPPSVAMPDNRLVQLLHQSVAYQMEFSRYHPKTIPKVTTLLRDFECEVLPNAVKSTYVGHSQNVKFVTFVGTDGELLASGSSDGTIKLWPTEILDTQQVSGEEQVDETTGAICRQRTRDLLGHSSRIWYLASSSSGERLFSGSGDGSVKIWDLSAALAERAAAQQVLTDEEELLERSRGAAVRQSAFDVATSGATSAIATAQTLPHNYSVTSAECLATLMSPNGGDVYTVNLHPSETHLVTGGYDQSVRLWDIATGAIVKTFHGHFASVCDAQFNRHANFIVSGSKDGSIRMWDILSGLCVHTLRQTLGEVTSISMASNGFALLSGSRNNSNRLWDLRMLNTPRAHLSTGPSRGVSTSGSSGSLGSYTNKGNNRGSFSASGIGLSQGAGYGSSGNFSTNGGLNSGSSIYSGSRNAEHRPLQRFKGHQNTAKNIVRASFGPRESFVLGGSEDGFVYVWEEATGKLLERLSGHCGVTYNAHWHEKQALLASSSHDGTVKTWWWRDKACQA